MLTFSLAVMEEVIDQVNDVKLVIKRYANIHTPSKKVFADATGPHRIRRPGQDPRFSVLRKSELFRLEFSPLKNEIHDGTLGAAMQEPFCLWKTTHSNGFFGTLLHYSS